MDNDEEEPYYATPGQKCYLRPQEAVNDGGLGARAFVSPQWIIPENMYGYGVLIEYDGASVDEPLV